jgi:hypothetical protein
MSRRREVRFEQGASGCQQCRWGEDNEPRPGGNRDEGNPGDDDNASHQDSSRVVLQPINRFIHGGELLGLSIL